MQTIFVKTYTYYFIYF